MESQIKIFNFDYPLFHVEHKQKLEDKIIRHYYFHEIGVETVGRFLFNLETKMNEIMPYYNKLYKIASLEYEELLNYDMVETSTRELQGESKSNGQDTSNNKSLFSDTPNGRVSIGDNYVTNITELEGDSKSTNTANTNTTEKHTLTRRGNIGVMSAQDLLEKEIALQNKIGNIDMLIVNDLSDLFMRVY